MAKTVTTSVEVVLRARATAARQEIKGLRRDVGEFGKFVRDTFNSASSRTVAAPKLSAGWAKLEKDVDAYADRIEAQLNKKLGSMRLRAPRFMGPQGSVPGFFGGAGIPRRSVPGSGTPGGGGNGGGASRSNELDESRQLTRQINAQVISAQQYEAELQRIASTAAAGSTKQLDALNKLRIVRKQSTSEAEADTRKLAAVEASEGAKLTRQWQAKTIDAKEYSAELNRIASTAVAGTDKQIDALVRLRQLEKATAADAERTANRRRQARTNTLDRVEAGGNLATRAGDVMTGVSVAGVAVMAAATRETVEYEKALRNVSSIADMTDGQFAKMYNDVLKVAKDPSIRQGPADLAKALYELQSSGFSVTAPLTNAKSAITALSVAAKGASAGLSDTATSSSALIAVMNSGIGGVTSTQQAMDVLFQTVIDGKVNFTELAGTIGNILPTAAKAGISLQDIGGAIAAMTIQGQSGAEATNDLLNLITKIANPGREAEKQFRKLGISFGFIGLQTKGLPGILEEINKKTHGHADALKLLLPDMQAQRGALSLLKNDMADYTRLIEQQKHASDGQGATAKALAEQNKSLAAQTELLRKEFQIIAVEVGPAFVRALREGLAIARPYIDKIKELAEAFVKLKPAQQDAIVKMGLLVLGIGPLVSAAGRLTTGIVGIARELNLLAPAAATANTSMGTLAAEGIAETGAASVTTAGRVGMLEKALGALGKIGRIGITVAITLVGAELLGQFLKSQGIKVWDPTKGTPWDKNAVGDFHTLSDVGGAVMDTAKHAGNAARKNDEANSGPLNQNTQLMQSGRADLRTLNEFSKTKPNYRGNLPVQVNDLLSKYKIATPDDLQGNPDNYGAVANLYRRIQDDVNRAKVQNQTLLRSNRLNRFSEQTGLSKRIVRNLEIPKGTNASLAPSTRNIVSNVFSKGGVDLAGGTVRRSTSGEFVMDAGRTLTDQEQYNIMTRVAMLNRNRPDDSKGKVGFVETKNGTRIFIQTRNKQQEQADAKKKVPAGPVMPTETKIHAHTGGGGGAGSRPSVDQTAEQVSKNLVAGAAGAYTDALNKYKEANADPGAAGIVWDADKQRQAQMGLNRLANNVYKAEIAAAEEKLKVANAEAAATRKQADTAKGKAKNADQIKAAGNLETKAANAASKAQAAYAGDIARINREHSARYEAIRKAMEKQQEEAAQQEAKEAAASHELQVKAAEDKIAAIEAKLDREQDPAQRTLLQTDKFKLMDTAATETYAGQMAAAKGLPANERATARANANAELLYTRNDIERQRVAANIKDTEQAIQNEVTLYELQANNLTDLLARHNKLKDAEDARLRLLEAQGATQAQIDAQREANLQAQQQREAGLARSNGQRLLVQQATSGTTLSPAERAAFAAQLGGFFSEEFNKTAPEGKGQVTNQQEETLRDALRQGVVQFKDITDLLRQLDARQSGMQDVGDVQTFYKGMQDITDNLFADAYKKADAKKGEARTMDYNALILGVLSSPEFATLSQKQREAMATAIADARDSKKETEEKVKKPGAIAKAGVELGDRVQGSIEQNGTGLIAGLFGNKDKAKDSAKAIWEEVQHGGRDALSKVGTEVLVKPIGDKIKSFITDALKEGSNLFEQGLSNATKGITDAFSHGVGGILQAANLLQSVMAVSGSQGKRSQKGGILGMVAGLGIGLATGGTGLALLSATTLGGSVGSQVADGNYLGAALTGAGAFMPGGQFAGKAGPKVLGPPAPKKGYGGSVFKGRAYEVGDLGRELMVPETNGMILPSVMALHTLPRLAAANNTLLSGLSAIVHGGSGGGTGGDSFTLIDNGDKHYEADTEKTFRKFTRAIRDTRSRKH